jgi:flagellar basal-body rod modification protein FlgD
MDFSSVTSASSTPAGSNNDIPVPTQGLTQRDFLKLLVAQMTSQDPLKPTDSQDLLSQMTQFSTLNANTALQTQIAQMQALSQFSEAGSLLGKQVTLQLDGSTTAEGIVTGVDTSSITPQLIVNGQLYSLGQVLSVANPTTTTTP